MNKYIYDAVEKYFKTLSKVGTIKDKDRYKLFIVNTVYNFYNTFNDLITEEDNVLINKFIQCCVKNSCLFKKSIPYLSYNTQDHSLITIIDSDIIKTADGNTMVATNNKTQKFTDFELRNELQDDNYVVGYDRSDDKEIAININDLGVFWE